MTYLALAVILWLPGQAVLAVLRPPAPGAPRPSALERLFVKVALSTLWLALVSVWLAEAGWLGLPGLLLAAGLPAAALLMWGWRHPAPAWVPRDTGFDSGALVVPALIVAGLLSFSAPLEQVTGARDPTTYVLWGIQAGREGRIYGHNELLRGLDPEVRSYLAGPDVREIGYVHRNNDQLGFYLVDAETALVVPQGLPLYPMLIAVGYLVGDVHGALWTTPVLALFGAVCLFFLGRRLAHPLVGALAAFWLLLSPAQVWFARYANAEVAAQVLVLLGLYFLVLYRQGGAPAFAAAAAMAFGLTWITHVWLVMVLPPLACLLLYELLTARARRRDVLWFWLPLAAMGMHALLQWRLAFWVYIWSLAFEQNLHRLGRALWLVPAAGATAVLGCWAIGRWWSRRRTEWIDGGAPADAGDATAASTGTVTSAMATGSGGSGGRTGPAWWLWARGLVVLAWLMLAAYGYWLRPRVVAQWWGPDPWPARHVEHLVRTVTPAGYWLAAIGVALLFAGIGRRGHARPEPGRVAPRSGGVGRRDAVAADEAAPGPSARRWQTRWGVVLGILLLAGLPVLYKANIRPLLMWSLRRYLPIVIPGTLLLAALALWWVGDRLPAWLRRRELTLGDLLPALARGASLGLALWIATALFTDSIAARGSRQQAGSVAMVEHLAAGFEPNAVLVFEARSDWRLLDFAPALSYWKGFDVVRLHDRRVDTEAMLALVRSQAQDRRPVYFLTQGFSWYFPSPRAVPHRWWRFMLEELAEDPHLLPEQILVAPIAFRSYRLETGGVNGPLPDYLNVGGWDDVYVGGMLPNEADPVRHRSIRWTTGEAYVWLPGLDESHTTVELDLGVPFLVDPQTLVVRLDDVQIGEILLAPGWHSYSFPVPDTWRPGRAAPRLTLVTDTFQPGGGDERFLGVRLDTVRWMGPKPPIP